VLIHFRTLAPRFRGNHTKNQSVQFEYYNLSKLTGNSNLNEPGLYNWLGNNDYLLLSSMRIAGWFRIAYIVLRQKCPAGLLFDLTD